MNWVRVCTYLYFPSSAGHATNAIRNPNHYRLRCSVSKLMDVDRIDCLQFKKRSKRMFDYVLTAMRRTHIVDICISHVVQTVHLHVYLHSIPSQQIPGKDNPKYKPLVNYNRLDMQLEGVSHMSVVCVRRNSQEQRLIKKFHYYKNRENG